jgi:chemotaxis protein MotB
MEAIMHNNTLLSIGVFLVMGVLAASGWYRYYDEREARTAQASDYQKRVERLMTNFQRSQQVLGDERKQLGAVEAELSQSRFELKSVKSDLESARKEAEQARSSERARDQAEFKALRAEIGTMEAELDSIQAELDCLMTARDDWPAQPDALRAEIGTVEAELDSIQAELDGLTIARDDWQAQVDALRAEIGSIEAELDSIQAELDGLMTSRDDWQAQADALRVELVSMRAQRGVLVTAREALEARADVWRVERNNLQAGLDALRANYARLRIERNGLRSEIDTQKLAGDARFKQLNEDLSTAQESERAARHELERMKKLVSKLAKHEDTLQQLSTQLQNKNANVSVMEQELARLEQQTADERRRFENLRSELQEELSGREIEMRQLKNQLTLIRVGSDILFDSGSAEVTEDGKTTLDVIAKILKQYPGRKVRVEGHTDNVPIGSSLQARYPSNWELSAARAARAVRYLHATGIEPAKFQVIGHGSQQPVIDRDDPDARSRNRRIEIVVLPEDSETVGDALDDGRWVDRGRPRIS